VLSPADEQLQPTRLPLPPFRTSLLFPRRLFLCHQSRQVIEVENPANARFRFAENHFIPTLHPLSDVAFPADPNRRPRDDAMNDVFVG
jgi:hypothetical protein